MPASWRRARPVVLCFCALFCASHAQQYTPAQKSTSSWIDWAEKLAYLSPTQQQLILATAGLVLQEKFGLDCNIFGSTSSCKALSTTTSYVKQCGAQAEAKVDCALFAEVSSNAFDSPVDNLEQYLAQTLGPQVKDSCPQCFNQVQGLWCALAVPPCGTFNAIVTNGLLPVFSKAVKAYQSSASATKADAVAKVMPQLMDVMGVGLPCRSMCEAMQSTCSCGAPTNDTLGSLMTWLAAQPQFKAQAKTPVVQYSRVLFKNIWDRPFCSLFPTRTTMPGRCTVDSGNQQCTSRQQWCDATHPERSSSYRYAQSLLLLQLLRATTGWLTADDAILWDVHDEVRTAMTSGPTADPVLSDQDWAKADQSHHKSAGQIIGIVFLSVFLAALATVGGVAGYRHWRQQREERAGYTELLASEKDMPFVTLSDAQTQCNSS